MEVLVQLEQAGPADPAPKVYVTQRPSHLTHGMRCTQCFMSYTAYLKVHSPPPCARECGMLPMGSAGQEPLSEVGNTRSHIRMYCRTFELGGPPVVVVSDREPETS